MKRTALFAVCIALLSMIWAQSQQTQTAAPPIDTLIAHKDYEKALPRVKDSLDVFFKFENWEKYKQATLQLVKIYYQQDDETKVGIILENAIQTLQDAGQGTSIQTAELYCWLAPHYKREENYPEVINTYHKAVRILEDSHGDEKLLKFCYKNMAQVFMRRMDYASASNYLHAAQRIDASNYAKSSTVQIANLYFWQDSLEKAWEYYQIAQSLTSTRPLDNALCASVGADIQLKRLQYTEAKQLYLAALNILKNNNEADYQEARIRCFTGLASISAHNNHDQEAENYFQKAEDQAKIRFKDKARETAKLYTEWGDFRRKIGDFIGALNFYQKAMLQSWPDFNNEDAALNPDPQKAIPELWAMISPARKAELLLQKEAPSKADRINAASCFEAALAAAEQLRLAYGNNEAKFYLQERNFNLRQEAALNLWEMSLLEPEKKAYWLAQLFNQLESNRATVLRDALQQQRALNLAGIPDSLLQLEDGLRKDLATIQQSLLATSDSAETVNLKTLQLKYSSRYNQLLADMESRYPQFAQYNNAGKAVNLEAVQQALPDSTLLLSWFDAGDRYLCLMVDTKSISPREIPKDSSLNSEVQQFLQILSNKQAQENNPNAFFQLAYTLRQKLLPTTIPAGNSQMVIIPDGPLCYLPFEALLLNAHQGAYGAAPWLLRQYAVRYAWSAALPQTMKQVSEKMLQVAPFIASGRGNFPALPNALQDVPADVSVKSLRDQEASFAQFEQNAPAFGILHLSTHAEGGATPGIELSDRRMDLSEVYAQRFQASLVCLSACETNTGELASGEGALSLARAFAYAGAQSLVASQWKVGDQATASIFSAFYNMLGHGQSKAQALQKAKLAYLQSTVPDAAKTPWHWAAFTLNGADGPVDIQHNRPLWQWGLLGICSIFLALTARRYLTQKRKNK